MANAVVRPDKLIIAGREWTVEWYVTAEEFQKACWLMGDAWTDDLGAATFQWEMTIRLRTDQHLVLQRENLLHEAMHAILYSTRSFGDDNVDVKDRDWEEFFISQLDTPLRAFMRDNKEAMRWILS